MKQLHFFRWLSIVLPMFFASSKLNGQIDEAIQYSPQGIFENVRDDDGRTATLSAILIDWTLPDSKGNNGIGATMNTGYFVLHFETGSGMELPADADHIARREVLSKVFQDISEFIVPASYAALVHLRIQNFADFVDAPIDALSTSSSYFIIPNIGGVANGDILNGAASQTIVSGNDAYKNLISPQNYFGQPEGETNFFYHGLLAFNCIQPFHLDINTSAVGGTIDMYSVALKEVLGLLGLSSLIEDNGTSRLGGDFNYYSRFDKACVTPTNQPYLVNTGGCDMCSFAWNPAVSVASCISNNYNNNTNNIHYHSTTQSGVGIASMMRSPSVVQLENLCAIGYVTTSTFGTLASLNASTYVNYCITSSLPSASNDGFNASGNLIYIGNEGLPLTISGSSFLENDSPNSSFECLQVMIGGGTLNATSGNSNSSIEYLATAAGNGYNVMRYVVTDGVGNSNFAYLIVRILMGGGGCEENECQLINNGDFEQFDGTNCTMSNIATQQCWTNLTGTCNILSPACAGFQMEFPTGIANGLLEDGIIGNGGALLIGGNTVGVNSFEEAAEMFMNQALAPGELYRLRFDARMATQSNNNPARIEMAFNSNLAELAGSSWNPGNFTQIFPFIVVPDDGVWQNYDVTLNAPNVAGLDVFMIGTNGSAVVPNLGGFTHYCIIDDIILEHIDDRTLQFPTNTCSPINWNNLMGFVSEAITNGEFFINGIGLGEGVNQWSTNTSGTYNVSFTYVDEFHTCQTITDTFSVIQSPDISFTINDNSICIGETVTLTATNIGGGPVNYTWAPTFITNPDFGPVVTATFISSNAVILTGSIGVCTDVFSQYIPVTDCPPPSINEVITNTSCYEGCDGSIALTAQNPFTVVWNTGSASATITSLCPGTYTATVSMQGFDVTTFTYVVENPPFLGTLYNGNLLPISGVVTWPNNVNIICDQNITINANSVLNITNGTNNIIRFTPGHGIIILPGGTLKANFTLFTSSCGDWWNGISCQATSQTVRALAQLNAGCIVEKAIHGIMNHNGANLSIGGKIQCSNMTFRNNDRDIELQGFNATTNDYGATFTACNFEITAPGFTPIDADNVRVWMNDVGIVYFRGCKFRNLDNIAPYLLTSDHMKAIRAFKCALYINDFIGGIFAASEIKGFDLGIDLVADKYSCSIYNTDFECYRGIYCSFVQTGSRIYNNNFNNYPSYTTDPSGSTDDGDLNDNGTNDDGSYALYMRYSAKNLIDENNVNMNQDDIRFGFAFYRNAGHNRLYHNAPINNMTRGVVAWGQNKQSATLNSTGLQIHCNSFTQDISFSSRNIVVDALGSTSALAGVQPYQRNGIGVSAGNTFTQSTSTFDDIFDNTVNGMEYFYHPIDNLVVSEVSILGNPDGLGGSLTIGTQYFCPVLPAPTNLTPEIVMSNLNATKSAVSTSLNTKKAQYNNLLDGGETENTITDVEYTTWQNVVDLYNDLLSKSPALSTEVMMEAIAKENDIPSVILTSILAANPTAAKDDNIKKALDERIIQLSDVQLAMIDLGLTQTSPKEELEWQMEELEATYDAAKSEALLTLIETGLEGVDVSTSIHTIMDADITAKERYQRVAYRIGRGEYADAMALLDMLPNDYPMRGLQLAEYDQLYPLFELQIELALGAALNASQIEYLEQITVSNFIEVEKMAWAILETEEIYPTQDILYPEGYIEPRSTQVQREDLHLEQTLTIYPNPTNDLCIIKTTLPVEGGKIVVIDTQGKMVLEQLIPKFQVETFISVGTLPVGMYKVQLLDANSGIVVHTSLIKQ